MQLSDPNKLFRTLNLEAGNHSQITVEIDYPKAHGEEFGCHVLIKGHETLNVDKTILGLDAMQALTLAIRFVCWIVMDNDLYKSGKLYWLEPGNDFDQLAQLLVLWGAELSRTPSNTPPKL